MWLHSLALIVFTERVSAQLEEVPSTAPSEVSVEAPAEASLDPQPGVEGAPVAAPAEVTSTSEGGLAKLRGRVVSEHDAKPVAGVMVFVQGSDGQAQTDRDGRFELVVPIGSHVLAVMHPQYRAKILQNVRVAHEDTSERSFVLTPALAHSERYIVVGKHIGGTVVALMEQRRATAAVTDAIGAEDIARMPASDAAQAAQRVVGATVIGGRYVYIRGLGERYTNAQLNGAPLPSPEPDRATVPLDLFPAQILESLDFAKTFTPDIPADFAGGSIRIVTRAMPDKPLFTASLSLGANSQSTLSEGLGHRGGDTDWLGFDDGTRALSEDVPGEYPLILGQNRPDGDKVLVPELDQAGLALNSSMSADEQTLPPNAGGNVVAGNGWQLGGDVRFGALGSLLYQRNFSARREQIREYQSSSSAEHGLQVLNRYDADVVSDEVRWGAFASLGLDVTKQHRLRLLGMRSQLSDKSTTVYDGYNENTESFVASSRLQFASRSLNFAQLQGHHTLPALNTAILQWSLSLGLADRSQPDLRDIVYALSPEVDRWVYANGSESGRHFFADQNERSYGLGVDWTQPLSDGYFESKLKFGSMLTRKDREFRARRFALRPAPRASRDPLLCGATFDPVGCPDELFVDENIGSVLRLEEGTREGDSYNAGLDVAAGYLMGDVGLGERARLVAGARMENTVQTLAPYDAFAAAEMQQGRVELKKLDVLPAASLVLTFSEQVALRLSAARTLARPQLRELAPFAFSDYFNGIQVSGNPELELTGIWNADARVEYFPTPGEVLALSVFVKDFSKPIEPIVRPSGTANILTYANAPGALLYGIELEARKKLGFLGSALDGFTLIGSLMLAQSEIQVRQTGTNFLTNLERPLVNQAPYVFNIALDYENQGGTQIRALYNVSGPTLVEVGTVGLQDAYQHPKHVVDFTASQAIGAHFSLKLSVQNLLDAEHKVTQGKEDQGHNMRYRYRDGVSASIGLRYKN
jgi:outer membrane receptor protein involved in Fe transport